MKKSVLKNYANFTENTCHGLFLTEGDSGTSVFLWILQNFSENFFYRTPLVAASEICIVKSSKLMLFVNPLRYNILKWSDTL